MDVLAAADARADRALSAHDLGEQAAGVVEAREVVPVPAVVAEDEVVVAKQRRKRDGHVLLTETRVRCAAQRAAVERREQPTLEAADEQHALEICVGDRARHGVLRSRTTSARTLPDPRR